jgi:predicted helicase
MDLLLGSLEALLATLDGRGRDFERLAQWFLTTDPEYVAYFSQVWLWDEWPDRWDIDRGIDLVGLRRDGGLVAIQAKNYALEHSITKRDVDTFLSESNRPVFAERLLIATTDKLARSARDVMNAQEKPVTRCLLARLEEAQVSWPTTVARLVSTARIRHAARPHQEEALMAIDRGLRVADRGQVVMACGTGKSLVALWAAEAREAQCILVLVPTIPLLRQTAQAWATHASHPFAALKVCSDRSQGGEGELRDLERADVGPGTTTDADEIASFMSGAGRRVIFSTYASSPKVADAMAATPEYRFDLAICDEAHWCAGLQTGANKTILDDTRIRAQKRLFFTATPEVYRPQDVEHLRRHCVPLASMNNRDLFGRVLHKLSLADAISQGLLCPYQVVFMPVTNDEVERLVEERTQVTADHGETRTDAYSLATQIACARAMRTYGCRRMVSFHPRIEHSRMFSAQFARAVALLPIGERPEGQVAAEHVDGGGMPPATRRRILRQFEQHDDTRRLLCNVKLLSEGFDAPGIDAITVIDTQRGQPQIIQMIGRAVRPMEGKEVGTIVLPVLVRGTESLNEAIARSEHRPIVKLLAALRSADPELERSLDHLRIQVGANGREIPPQRRFVLDVAQEVDAEFAKAIDVMLVDTLAPSQRAAKVRAERALSSAPVAPVVVELGTEGPMAPAVVSKGLAILEDYAQSELATAPRHHTVHESFPLGRWWTRMLEAWNPATPDEDTKQRIADLVTWLSVDREKYPHVRRDLMVLSPADVVDHIHTYLDWRDVDGALADLVRINVIGPFSDLDTERIHAALTFPEMPRERQVELVCKALHDAGWEAKRRQVHAKAFTDGFLDAIEHHPEPCPVVDIPATPEADSAAGQYVAGWQHAEPLFDVVLEARRRRTRSANRH